MDGGWQDAADHGDRHCQLTENTARQVAPFADGQTQQWLMVRLEDPAAGQ